MKILSVMVFRARAAPSDGGTAAAAAAAAAAKAAPIELYYWHNKETPFAGRGEWVRLMLALCGFEFVDVSRDTGDTGAPFRFVHMYKGKVNEKFSAPAGAYPVMFPPIIKDGDVVLNQTTAILVYLARKAGKFMPSGAVAEAHVLQLTLAAFDTLSGAEHAHHPVAHNASYESQKAEADKAMAAWSAERLPSYLSQFERALAYNNGGDGGGGSGFLVGDAMSVADVALFQLMRGYRSSLPAHFAANADIARVKAHTAKIEALPDVAAFLASDKCTKMEGGPPVQANSFM